jgi:hypothetical protein
MVDDASVRALHEALKAVDEVAAALQAHLVEEHHADPEPNDAQGTFAHSMKLLRHARERLGNGLRAIDSGRIPPDEAPVRDA